MTCGIYMIQNKVNNKIYIGQGVDIERRWGDHKAYLRGNYHENKHLQKAWNKYGEDNFEFTIVCECNENQLNTMEEYYIFELMTYNDKVGYNKTFGGGGCRATEETKQKMSETRKGKTLSKEHRKKMSENNGRYWKGKTRSEETRDKISKSLGKGVKNPKSISVVQLTLGGKLVEVYGSSRETERNGFNHRHINDCIKGKRKTHGGYKWMYLHEYIAKMNPNIKTINLFRKLYNVNQEVSV